jgi:hypothetical protein
LPLLRLLLLCLHPALLSLVLLLVRRPRLWLLLRLCMPRKLGTALPALAPAITAVQQLLQGLGKI